MFGLVTGVYAGGQIEPPVEVVLDEHVEEHVEHAAHSPYYVIVKGLTIGGDKVSHGADTLDGERGYGFGIDLGYRVGAGFALEYDFSYATNTVEETTATGAKHEGDATYVTHAIHLVYTYHLTHTLGLFVKGGYEYETEEIEDLHIDKNDDGFAYAAGLEYALNDHYTAVLEYEQSTIDGPRDDALFLGMMYNF